MGLHHLTIEAQADAGLAICDACGFVEDQSRMLFNADGSASLCATAAKKLTPCCDEEVECASCLHATPRKELDAEGTCGCLAVPREWIDRIQIIAARDARAS
jgi:hypothetical protein